MSALAHLRVYTGFYYTVHGCRIGFPDYFKFYASRMEQIKIFSHYNAALKHISFFLLIGSHLHILSKYSIPSMPLKVFSKTGPRIDL